MCVVILAMFAAMSVSAVFTFLAWDVHCFVRIKRTCHKLANISFARWRHDCLISIGTGDDESASAHLARDCCCCSVKAQPTCMRTPKPVWNAKCVEQPSWIHLYHVIRFVLSSLSGIFIANFRVATDRNALADSHTACCGGEARRADRRQRAAVHVFVVIRWRHLIASDRPVRQTPRPGSRLVRGGRSARRPRRPTVGRLRPSRRLLNEDGRQTVYWPGQSIASLLITATTTGALFLIII